MIHLIKKDLILQKKTVWFGLIYSIFLFIVFNNEVFKEAIYIMAGFGISYIAIVGIAQAEFKSNSDIILNSFPLTRREIVLSKYLSLMVFTSIAVIGVGLIGAIFHAIPLYQYRLINCVDVVIIFMTSMFLAAVSIPAHCKSGAQWVLIVNMLLFFAFFFAPAQIIGFLSRNEQQPWVHYLMREQGWLLSLAGIGIIMVILFISYIISLKIYLHKDL